jgi:predicted NBD/HSP70 family sugar kinase
MTACQASNLLRAGQPSVLVELAAGDADRRGAPLVFAAAAREDPAAVTTLARAAQAVGPGAATLISTLSKESGALGAAAWFLYERSRVGFA